MGRSRRLGVLAVGGALALSYAAQTAPAYAADEPVAVTQFSMVRPTEVRYLWAGASGLRYTLPQNGSSQALWADYEGVTPPAHPGPGDLASGADVLTGRSGGVVTQQHHATGVTAKVTVPAEQTYLAAVGWSVLTKDAAGALHVLRAGDDGATRDIPVTGLPSGAEFTGTVTTGGSVRYLAVGHRVDGTVSTGLVDLADGTLGVSIAGSGTVLFNDRWLIVGNRALRTDAEPGTAPVTVSSYLGNPLAVVGDQLLSGNAEFLPVGERPTLQATSLTTGVRRTLVDNSYGAIAPSLDGGALATGGADSDDWYVHRITAAADGDATAARVLRVPALRASIDGLMLAGGELLMQGNPTNTGGVNSVYAVPLDRDGKPAGRQTFRISVRDVSPCLGGDAACPQLEALGDGRFAYLATGADGTETVRTANSATSYANAPTGDTKGRIGTGTGRYVLYNGSTPGVQKVADFARGADGAITLSRTRTAAAIWGQRLWTPGTTEGSVVAYDLKAKRNVATVDTGAPCIPSELQAVNAWLYWSCGSTGPAGVYDRATGRAIPVPAGQGRLADGYLVREDRTSHALLLTDFHSGTATTRTVAVLPAYDKNTGGHTGRWAVDRFGGHIAYLTATSGEVALVTAKVPTSPLAQLEAQTEAGPGPTTASPWQPVWQLNKPATWTLKLYGGSGSVVRTLTGATAAAAVRASWNGVDDAGRPVARGTYTWDLTAEPRDGQGPALSLSGTTTVN
ncbi:FlgD immunoglobulin-like domain containing protein [Streptomyces sp. NPDC046939]|uniref:FlgD immunoglobulin-like domain containing protein n=1 Tax=Streptomyces sp. NPDC046939 TaxID=3155376 RepID=UPI0033C5DACC